MDINRRWGLTVEDRVGGTGEEGNWDSSNKTIIPPPKRNRTLTGH